MTCRRSLELAAAPPWGDAVALLPCLAHWHRAGVRAGQGAEAARTAGEATATEEVRHRAVEEPSQLHQGQRQRIAAALARVMRGPRAEGEHEAARELAGEIEQLAGARDRDLEEARGEAAAIALDLLVELSVVAARAVVHDRGGRIQQGLPAE